MKRMLGILMALMLFVAPALAQSATVEGDWELISLVIEGNTYENLAQQGMVMTMRLEADGTGVQTVNGDEYSCTWVETDGEIQISGSDGAMSYVLQADGTLVGIDQVGDSMIFARPAADSPVGAWTLTAAEAEGIVINDTATLNVELDLTLYADGTGLLASGEKKAACTWTQSGSTVTVVEENSTPLSFALQSDGTLAWVLEDDNITLILSRTDAAAEAPEALESAAVVSEYGFRVRLPEGWFAIDSEYVGQFIESVGEEIASAKGIDQNLLNQLAAANMSLFYAPNMIGNFNVVREDAGGVTMDNFPMVEATLQQVLSSQGITDFRLSGPVEINGKSYYVGNFTAQAGFDQMQYYCVANGYLYTITLTNVSDVDAQQIMESFEVP